MNFTFIIPCHNSEKIIINNYKKLNKFISQYKLKSKIIYINDSSKDNTFEELKKINDKKVSIINNKINLGKSKSISKILKKINTDFVILIDCDLPYFKYLNEIIKNLKKYELVIVNRRLSKSLNLDEEKNIYRISRNFISVILGIIVEIKLKLKVYGDTQAGLKGFKFSKEIKKYKFLSKYYFLDIELINFFRKKEKEIKLIPVRYKISKKSSIKFFSLKNFKIIFELFYVLLKIQLVNLCNFKKCLSFLRQPRIHQEFLMKPKTLQYMLFFKVLAF